MQHYGANKFRTVCEIVRRIENWTTALDLRIRRRRPGLNLLRFRSGLNVVCRGGTRDWGVLHELLFAGSYGRAFAYLHSLADSPIVIDLGGNIGLFSLLAASYHPRAIIYAYEPGPPNYRLFEINCLANPDFADRIHLRKEAVGGGTRIAEWFFDQENPGGSGLSAKTGIPFQVQIRSWADVISTIPGKVALAKIDIEGAEFELLANSPAHIWEKISAISLELHEDPQGKLSQQEFLNRMAGFGFKIEEETVCSYFLRRP
jgi:FkbM family methyltransferase